MTNVLEVCVDSVPGALRALASGADRIELCAALSEGGLTPNFGTFLQIRKKVPVYTMKIYVMLRPRRGCDFQYTDDELESILIDLELFKEHGADGFVFGALSSPRKIDDPACRRILAAAGDLPVTFHRAFDVLEGNPEAHLQILVDIGFKRLLTSGQHSSALAGLTNITKWNKIFGHLLVIMPGAGINAENLAQIAKESHCREFHSSCRDTMKVSINPIIGDLEGHLLPSEEAVKTLVHILRQ